MSHSRGKDQNNPGKFAFECFDWSGDLFRSQGGFDTAQEADQAAQKAEREMMAVGADFGLKLSPMTDDELLAELLA